jgi:hypothetical protein
LLLLLLLLLLQTATAHLGTASTSQRLVSTRNKSRHKSGGLYSSFPTDWQLLAQQLERSTFVCGNLSCQYQSGAAAA